MHLKQLRAIVKQTLDEEKAADALRSEVARVFGPSIDTNVKLLKLAEAVNDCVSVMNLTGRSGREFRTAVVAKFVHHPEPEVRKMAANLLPEQLLGKMATDRSSVVRAAVARRHSLGAVKEMMRRFPKDDEIRAIYRRRLVTEAGLPKPKVDDGEFDMYGEERLGDSVKQGDAPELSDVWYREKAQDLVRDYGRDLEHGWETKAVNGFCRHSKATNGVEIDAEKLLGVVKEILEDREDERLEVLTPLAEIAASLRASEPLVESNLYDDSVDPVQELLEADLSPGDYVTAANKLFRVMESRVPPSVRKHRLGVDPLSYRQTVPMKAFLPHKGGLRTIDEQALDAYTKHWSDRAALTGEPLKLDWSVHPGYENAVTFKVILR